MTSFRQENKTMKSSLNDLLWSTGARLLAIAILSLPVLIVYLSFQVANGGSGPTGQQQTAPLAKQQLGNT